MGTTTLRVERPHYEVTFSDAGRYRWDHVDDHGRAETIGLDGVTTVVDPAPQPGFDRQDP